MAPGVNPDCLMCTTFRAQSRKDRSPERMEVTQAVSDREDALGALADHVVSEEHRAEKECQMHTEETENVSQGILREAIAGISGLVEDKVTMLITQEGHNKISRTDS